MKNLWSIVNQGAVNQYHEVVVLGCEEKRIAVWLPRDPNLDFVVTNASVERIQSLEQDR